MCPRGDDDIANVRVQISEWHGDVLSIGTKLGPYEIGAPLGAGGMGEVYRARDTKLNREVAIKVLLPAVANDPDRLARFSREAQVLASLNHQNIAHIYGIEDADGVKALVLELVEGEDLAQRIARGPIPLDEALPIARQIADALEAAHEQGIIHRDLKPANIKARPDGTVKVLDFGLAKAMDPAGGANANAMNSPTLSMHATQAGIILGTAAYMSPEQARGTTVDKRADIWAFGVVMFEMLTGRRVFEGETLSDTLASLLKTDPAWSLVPADVPPAIKHLIQRCLVKDPRQRIRDMGDVRLALDGANDPAPAPNRHTRRLPVWTLAGIAAASLAVATYALWSRPTVVPRTSARLTIPLPPGQEVTSYPAITHDGRTVAYVTRQGTDDAQLYLRDMNALEGRAVAGSSGAKQPFFSPDGKWVAFFAQGLLQKAEVAGGAPIRIAEAAMSYGGTWNEDNTVIYVPSLGSGLLRIPASGGTPESLTMPDGAAKGYAHVFPQMLPGGRRVLFTIWGQTQGSAILALDSAQWEVVLPGTGWAAAMFDAPRAATGRLLVVDQTAGIRSAPFDAAHASHTSVETSVLSNVFYDVENEARGWLAVSDNRTAVYAPGNPAHASLVWVDREGKVESAGKDQDVYREATLSPDGIKAVVRHGLDLWIHDLQRGTRSRLTPLNTSNLLPLWSRDGTRIIFASNRGGHWGIYAQPADGSRPAEALLTRPDDQYPRSILADGTVLYLEIGPKTGRNLWTLSPDGKTSRLPFASSKESDAEFSPDVSGGTRWVAYSSEESGRSEIYVQSYPAGTNRIPISSGGGVMPRWSHDGKELFYVTGDAIVSVGIAPNGSFGAGRKLFDASNYFINRFNQFNSYDVSPDGTRFLMIQRDPASVPRQLNVILNWTDEMASR